MSRPSVEELKDLQRTRVLTDAHVVYVDERGFVISHTDAERDRLDDLEECRPHQFLFNEGPPDVELPARGPSRGHGRPRRGVSGAGMSDHLLRI